ncbi:hypothetical protein L9F63_002203 [Diploptera punctata]|uniref:Uncharacterized protein n=1 Tax=Diploptera punctata TaxID=6984 RepID=A0AAD8A352_DIPPU|nr:hypothetical protein L9F63_002203 [Diploptera punctata]
MITECVTSIINLNFDPGRSIIVSFPTKMDTLFDPDLMENILRNINSRTQWSLIVGDFIKESPDVILGKNYDYLIMLSVDEMNDMLESLETQLENLESSSSWNPRNKFVIVVTGNFTGQTEIPLTLLDFLWKSTNLVNVIILIQKVEFMDVYTWFPYGSTQCANVEEIIILDKCIDGQFIMKNELFPPKIPSNLNGCPLIVSVSDFRPYLILTDNSTDDEHKYRGYEMEYIILICKKMNMTLVYSEISNENVINMFTDKLAEVMIEKVSDIAIGAFPLHPFFNSYGDPSIPYLFSAAKWCVPCPKLLPRMQRITSILSPFMLLMMLMVFLLATFVIYHISDVSDSDKFLKPVSSLYVAWAVLLGISVLDMPKSLKLRLFFTLLLWYCFIMNVMFQAVIVSLLIEPGFENELKTFDELVSSNIRYAYYSMIETLFTLTSYNEHRRFPDPPIIYHNYSQCLEDIITGKMIATICTDFYAEYLNAITPQKGQICFVDESIASGGVVMYMSRGNPLLPKINELIQRCFESGLVDVYWSIYTWKLKTEKINE